MKNKLIAMVKNSVWKNSFVGALIFSLVYNLFFTESEFTALLLLPITIASFLGATIGYYLDRHFRIVSKLDKLLLKYPAIRKVTPQILMILSLSVLTAVINTIAFLESDVSELVDSIANSAWRFGSLVVILVMMAEFVASFKSNNPFDVFKRGITRLLMLSVVALFVRYSGDFFIQLANKEPLVLVQGLTVFVLILFAFKMAEKKQVIVQPFIRNKDEVVGVGRAMAVPDEPIITEKDRKFVRDHEAGHALVHGLLVKYPPNLSVSIKPHFDGSLGRVSSNEGYDNLKTKSALEWIMYRNLGGAVAEQVLNSEQTSGCVKDSLMWESNARSYLSNGFGDHYYLEPTNGHEVASNNELFKKLKEGQSRKLADFFEINKALLIELSDLLDEKEVLVLEELTPILDRVNSAGLPKVEFTFE